MKEYHYRKPPKSVRVGLAINPDYVIGEWRGTNWSDIPETRIKLYSYNLRPWWHLYRNGNAAIRRWVHTRPTDLSRRSNYPSSIIAKGQQIYTTREVFRDTPPDESFAILREYAEFLEANGGSVASMTGGAQTLWKATLKIPFREFSMNLPDQMIIGSRQDFIGPGSWDRAEIWDIQAAYAYALGMLKIPGKWKEYQRGIPDEGFVYATVKTPNMAYGPLPLRENGKISYPRDESFEGLFTVQEIQAAKEVGTDINIQRAWAGGGNPRQPFREWWDIIKIARTELSPTAQKIFKISSNTLWATFAMSGQTWEYRFVNGMLRRRPIGGKLAQRSRAIPALVSGEVRAKLFREALANWPIISCHTDGVITLVPLMYATDGRGPGTWRMKLKVKKVDLVGPQIVRFETEDGEEIFKIAGTVTGRNLDSENIFRNAMFKAMRRQAEIDLRDERIKLLERMGI